MKPFIQSRPVLCALIACLIQCSANRTLADGEIHLITGYVRDTSGNPVAGVEIIGDDYVGTTLDSWPSDENGFYIVDAVIEGNYRLSFNCSQLAAMGYQCPEPLAISVASEQTDHDFVLEATGSELQITNLTLPRGNFGMSYNVGLGASGGQPPYTWQLAADSTNLPSGLSLDSDGLISGTPAQFGIYNIKAQVTDSGSVVTNRQLLLVINPQPFLSDPVWTTNRFTMRLSGAPGQNYTLQMSTNPASGGWNTLYVTNNPNVGSYLVRDPNATNRSRFYRVLIGP
ncbi:MAG TPA: carboxypeptidase regulatory-like domain-containing protein [Verrucomicrobiota bacterium]|nr:carboxypeptidase regulatory-like domain-containing protein [Verrucomicrobiota bacterium]